MGNMGTNCPALQPEDIVSGQREKAATERLPGIGLVLANVRFCVLTLPSAVIAENEVSLPGKGNDSLRIEPR